LLADIAADPSSNTAKTDIHQDKRIVITVSPPMQSPVLGLRPDHQASGAHQNRYRRFESKSILVWSRWGFVIEVVDALREAQALVMSKATENAESAETVLLGAGEFLFREGDLADALYIVRKGLLRIVSGSTVYETVRPGGIIGEMGIVDEGGDAARLL
jgi:Cyclic nucleotide-binding domain